MSEKFRKQLETGVAVFALVGGIGGILSVTGSVLVWPYRIQQVEATVAAVKSSSERDHELLTRIDERLENIMKQLRREK